MEASLDKVVAAAKERGQLGGLQDVIDWLKEKLLEDGICANRDALLAKIDWAIDQVVKIDVPSIPSFIEASIDEILANYAKAKARVLMSKVCP